MTYSSYREITENQYSMIYIGDEREKINCGDIGDMYLELFENNEKLKIYVKPEFIMHYIFEGEEHPCPNGGILPPFPSKKEKAVSLTKKKKSFIKNN